MVLLCDGVADPLPVLVAADAPQGIAAPVEKEPLSGIYPKVPHTKTGADLIYRFIPYGEGCHYSVKIRIPYPIP